MFPEYIEKEKEEPRIDIGIWKKFPSSIKPNWNGLNTGGTILSDPLFNRQLEDEDDQEEEEIQYCYPKRTRKRSWCAIMDVNHPDHDDDIKSDETQRLVSAEVGGGDRNHQNNEMENENYVDQEKNYQKKICSNNNNGCHWSLYKGIFYSSMSSVFFSLSAVIVKYLKDIHPGELAVCRFCGIFILTIPLVIYHDLNPFGTPELRPLLILRGIAGATSLFLRFVSFHYLSIADASVIIFSVPVLVSIFAWFYLKEPCGLFHSFTVMIAMLGLVMTTKLPLFFDSTDETSPLVYSSNYYAYQQKYYHHHHHHHQPEMINSSSTIWSVSTMANNITQIPMSQTQQRTNHFLGVLAALSSLIFSSSVFIFIRKAKGAHYAVIMFNFGWVAILETTVLTALLNGFSMPKNAFQWYLIVTLGVFSFCGQILLTRALQLEQAGPVSVVRATTDIALAFLWQLAIFKEIPDCWSISGALMVSSCIVLTALRKWVISLPEHSRMKEKLYFLLI